MRLWIALFCLIFAAPAYAEGFFEILTGGAFTESERARVSLAGIGARPRVPFDDSGVLGVRAGLWGEGELPFLGASWSVSGYSPDGDGIFDEADFAVIPLSMQILGRLPLLTSDRFPDGQIQPYLGIGPSLVFSSLHVSQPNGDFDDRAADLGVDLRTGIAVLLGDPVGIFTEYRFLHFEPDYDDGPRSVSTEISTHFIQVGLTFRF